MEQFFENIFTAIWVAGYVFIFLYFFIKLTKPSIKDVPKPTSIYSLYPVSEWTLDEIAVLNKFLTSETGRRLLIRARAMERENALAGCQDSVTTTHSAARAAGFSDCLNWIESLCSDELVSKLSVAPSAQGANITAYETKDDVSLAEPRRSF